MSTPTTVLFRVGSDREVVETVLFLDSDTTTDDIRRKIAARGLTSPNQFPASAVYVVDTVPSLDVVDDFLAASPHYDRAHVWDIADARVKDGTPYCRECHDWHDAAPCRSSLRGKRS